jgi:hypothetical protein
MHMSGMMSEAELRQLAATSHEDFDLMFFECGLRPEGHVDVVEVQGRA